MGVNAQTAPAAPEDPVYNAAKAAFENLDEAARQSIQDDLVWTGDYNGVTRGVYGRMSYRATVAFQKRQKLGEDGILSDKARAMLAATAKANRDAAKFVVETDAKTKIRIGIPRTVLGKRSDNPWGGSRWQSADDKITLDTRAFTTEETDLDVLFERATAVKAAERKITYKYRGEDFFVVTAETATGKSYTRYTSGSDGIRGFLLGYDKSASPQFDKMVIAIANSFDPFPGAAAISGAQPSSSANAGGTNTAAASSPSGSGQAAVSWGNLPSATGLVVAKGRVLTVLPSDACRSLSVDGKPAKIERTQDGLTLLSADIGTEPMKLKLGQAEGDVTVISMANNKQLIASSGKIEAPGIATASLIRSSFGAPLYTDDGSLAGIVASLPSRGDIDGHMPAAPRAFIPTANLQRFLDGTATFTSAGEDRPSNPFARYVSIVAVVCK